MSEVMLTLRDEQRSIHYRVHGSEADRIMAALSADPETIDELEHALLRFQASKTHGNSFRFWYPGDCDQPWDAGVYVVDLPAHLIAGQSSYFNPVSSGTIAYADDCGKSDLVVSYHLADHWEITRSIDSWPWLAERRRTEFAALPRIDTRKSLFNNFYQYAVQHSLLAAADSSANPIVPIHRKWLLTPREELAERSPRDVLLADQHHLDMDLQHRELQWEQSGQCPPGIPETAAAYRYAGIGRHAWVVHYEFVRFVLGQCWSSLQQRPNLRAAEEAHRVEREAKSWLQTPHPDWHGLTPVQVMERERRRLPLVLSPKEASLDADCPICQMLIDTSGPLFWHLDGRNMEDEFAFSSWRTREEWDEEQQQFEQDFDELPRPASR